MSWQDFFRTQNQLNFNVIDISWNGQMDMRYAFMMRGNIMWRKRENYARKSKYFFFLNFCRDKSPFYRATGILCFEIQLTLPMGFKARVDAPLPVLYSHLRIMDPQSQLWLSRPGPGPNFTPWYGEAAAGVTAQHHFQDC